MKHRTAATAGARRPHGALARRMGAAVLRSAGVVLLFLAGAGCMTIGKSFPADPIQQIRIGQTDKAQLLATYGLPYRRGIEDGDSTWTYLHYKLRLFGEHARTRDLYIRFNEAGVVKSYTYNSNMEGE